MRTRYLSFGRRLFWLLILVTMVVSSVLSVNALKVKADSKNVYFVKEIGFIDSFDGFVTPNGFEHRSLSEQDNYILSDADNKASSGMYIYCIEPGVYLNGSCTIWGNDDANALFKNDGITTPEKKKELISLIGARSGFMKTWEGAEGWKSKTKYLVGQILIWEVVGGARDANFNLRSPNYSLREVYHFKDWNGETPGTASEIKEYFNEKYDTWSVEVQNILKEEKKISYANGSTYELQWNSSKNRHEKSFTDTNKVTSLFSYAYSRSDEVWSSKSIDGNTIVFSTYDGVEINKNNPLTVTFTGRTDKVTSTIDGWIPSDGKQKCISFGDNTSRDIVSSMKLYTETIYSKVFISKKALTGSDELPGATLELKDSRGKLVEKWVSTNKSKEFELLIGETYTLKETLPPNGYVTSNEITFEVNDSGTQVITMKDDVTKISISKLDVDGNYIDGAKMSILDSDGKVVHSFITGNREEKINGVLSVGETYTLREDKAPIGYVRAKDFSFKVLDTSNVQKVTMVDKVVSVTKVDITDGKELPGAEIVVTENETGEEVDRWVSTEEPHNISNLEENKEYTLTEVLAPEGYDIAESIVFKVEGITEDGIKVNEHYTMEDSLILTDIIVKKIDSKTGKEVTSEDFEFTLYSDEECTEVITVGKGENGVVTFNDLKYGKYYLKETKSPEGYLSSNKVIKISIDSELEGVGEEHTITVENEQVETEKVPYKTTNTTSGKPVKTGDSNEVMLCIAVMVSMVLVVVFLCREKSKVK